MAYDGDLADRVRLALRSRAGISEKQMFGGLAFLEDGRMVCGVIKEDLMVRVGPTGTAAALAKPHVRPMDFTGKPLKSFVYVGPAGCRTAAAVKRWVEVALRFVATLER